MKSVLLMMLAVFTTAFTTFGGKMPNTTQVTRPIMMTTNSSGIITITGLKLLEQPRVRLPYQTLGTRTDIGQSQMKTVNLAPQKPLAVMKPVNEVELARQRAEYNACKQFVKDAKSGAYDGRWSSGGVGQAAGFQRMMNANKAAEQCPTDLLNPRPLAEWTK